MCPEPTRTDPARTQHVAAMRARLADLGVDVGEFPRPAALDEDAGPVIGAGTRKALAALPVLPPGLPWCCLRPPSALR